MDSTFSTRGKIFSFLFILMGAGGTAAHAATVSNPGSSAQVPAALRTAYYKTLRNDHPHASRFGRTGCAVVATSGLRACFDKSGVRFNGARVAALSMRLTAYGRGDHLQAMPTVRPSIRNDQVTYVQGNVTEWWRALPVGFEQGFTLSKRVHGHGKLVLALKTGSPASRHGNTLDWGALHYGKLAVTDAKGRTVPAKLEQSGGRILIAINDAQAAYPLTVDPLVWVQQEVMGTSNDNSFGNAVAISGKTALIGAPNSSVGSNANEGLVYVFTESGGKWSQSGTLTPKDGVAYEGFGTSVAFDGSTAVVGVPNASVSGVNVGAAYVFSDSNGTWSQVAKLSAGGQSASFGWSVAVAGNEMLIGADNATVGTTQSEGAAFVYTLSNGSWTQSAELTAKDGAGGNGVGTSVAIEGNTAIVGSERANVGANSSQGAVYVFTNSNGTWSQTAKLSASDGQVYGAFGASVAFDGKTLVVGSPGATINGNPSQGAAYLFSNATGSWAQVGEFNDPNGSSYESYAQSVSISGSTVVVGNNNKTVGGDKYRGAVWVYSDSNGTWGLSQMLIATDGATSDGLGGAVSIDGNTILAGAPLATVNGNANQGKAYFYGHANLGLSINVPDSSNPGATYQSQVIATNNATSVSPDVAIIAPVPAAASYLSAAATQGSCSEADNSVTCDFGSIDGNAGTATANITLKVTHIAPGTVHNTASVVAQATPALSASAATQIVDYNPPVASNGSLTVKQGATGNGTLQASDPNNKPVTYSIVVKPSNGTLTLTDASKGTYTYTPDKNFSGNDSFAFEASDGEAVSNIATVSITVEKKKSSSGGGAIGVLGRAGLLCLIGLGAVKRRRLHAVQR